MTNLHISPHLDLDEDYVTKTVAILAQRRKGKTYTASVIAEELAAAGIPWVALDPTGAWWGLRSSSDGNDPGLPVVILGGQHGDVPLEHTAGRYVAELVIEHPAWYVLDLSLFESKTAERTFAADFGEALYRRKGQPGRDFPLHLFVDEADMFVPQDRESGDMRMLGAFQSIVRRGGLRGLGTTLISQRPALVNKSVLVQLDMLIVLRLVAGNDQDYLKKNYFERNGSKEQVAELMDSLASLNLGEAWAWDPGADLFARLQVRQRDTFNSSATPKPGEQRIEPRALADVDLDAVKEQMAATIERAKADDPKELRRQIAQLKKQLTERPAETVTVDVVKEIVPGDLLALVNQTQRALCDASDQLVGVSAEIGEALDRWAADREEHHADRGQDVPRARPAGDGAGPVADRARPGRAPQRPDPQARRDTRRQTVPRAPAAEGDVKLGTGELKILTAIAQHDQGVTAEQLSVLTAYKRSSRNTYVQRLKQHGLVVAKGDRLHATGEGLDVLGDTFEPLPTGSALRDYWMGQLPEGERRIFAILTAAWPDWLPGEDLDQQTGYKRSSRNTYLQRLRARQLVETDRGAARASDLLFDPAE